MLTQEQIQLAADNLYKAETQRQQIEPISLSHPEIDMDDAYAIQECWVNKKIADGQKVIGYKIGLTSKAMQRVMKISTPDYGVLLDSMHFTNNSQISTADYLDPQIETELAFVLKKELSATDVSIDEVMDATDYIVPALELIAARSFRIHPETGYTRKVFDTIADNAANAGIITGDVRIDPKTVDLRWCGAIVSRNNEVELTGLAAAVLSHPAEGISWVARRFAKHNISLQPGQIILSGSFTAPLKVKQGDTIHADYGTGGGIINVGFI